MNESLLFLNALSSQLDPSSETSMETQVQELIAHALNLPFHVVQDYWLDVHMTQVRERYSRSDLPSMRETLKTLFDQNAKLVHLSLLPVIIAPESFHVDKMYVLRRDVGRMTGQHNMILLMVKNPREPQVFVVNPEIQRNVDFQRILQQLREVPECK